MKVKISFPEDIAQQKAEEAREWQPGAPMVWEAEDVNAPQKFKRVGDNVILETEHTKVELSKEEVAKLHDLYQ